MDCYLLSFGFCDGIKRAIDTINQSQKLYNPLYIFDNIIYNREFVNQILNNNKTIIKVNTFDDVPDEATVISSVYGIESNILQEAEKRDITIVDITCPFIADIQAQIKKLSDPVIIIGDIHNQEVIALSSCTSNVYVINNHSDIDLLPDFTNKQVTCFSQSTICKNNLSNIIEKLKNKIPNIIDKTSICPTIAKRQQEIIDISTSIDGIIIVGDLNSPSTNSLIQTAQMCNINKIIHIPSDTDFDLNTVHDISNVAITSGIDVSSDFVQKIIDKLQLSCNATISDCLSKISNVCNTSDVQ